METMSKGAEATLYRDDRAVVKQRHQKKYRHSELDERLRRERTDREARLLQAAREAGVNVPDVEETGEFELRMEMVTGTVLKDVAGERSEMWPAIGESVARLHRRNVIHGDLTTSNMIVQDEELYLIDFGLGFFSERVEDRATDLHLLQEVLESTHPDLAEDAMDAVLAAYREESDDAAAVVDRFDEIEERGRYTG